MILTPPVILGLVSVGMSVTACVIAPDQPTQWFTGFGWCLVAASVVIVGWASEILRRNDTTVRPGKIASQFVTTGPFRFSRNPIYVALVSNAIGKCLKFGTAWNLYGPPVLALALHLFFILPEEQMLEGKFGKEFLAYRRHVCRWVSFELEHRQPIKTPARDLEKK